MKIFSFISSVSTLLPIVFFLCFFKRNRGTGLWVIFFYVLLSFSTDISFAIVKSKVFHFHALYSFTILEYLLFTGFLYLNLHSQTIKKVLLFGSITFIAFATFSLLKKTDYKFDSLPASIEAILVICYCVLFFYEQLKSPESPFIYSSKSFWITVAMLVYLAATLCLFISTAYISDEERKVYWPINYAANFIKNAMLSIAFILKPGTKQSSSIQKTYNI